MKSFQPFLAICTIAVCAAVNAQTVTTVNVSNLYGGYGHVRDSLSFTIRMNVTDLGNQTCLVRSVDVDPFGTWTDPIQDVALSTVPLGIHEFNVPLTSGAVSYELTLHYRYISDPDGPGGANAGDDIPGYPKIISDVQPKANPNIHFEEFWIIGNYLHIELETGRYVDPQPGGTEFYADILFDLLDDNGFVAWNDLSNVNPAGYPTLTKTYDIWLGLLPPGLYCPRARLLYSHDGPGNSYDFIDHVVDETDPVCDDWVGISTDTSELTAEGMGDISLYPNPTSDQIKLGNLEINKNLEVCDARGRMIRTLLPSAASIAHDVSDLAAGIYMVKQGGRICRFSKT